MQLIADGVNAICGPAAKKKMIALAYNIDPRTSSVKGPASGELIEILENFVNNAIKFSDNGSQVKIQIVCRAEKGKEMLVRFEVIDKARGISEENQKGLFKPYGQVGVKDRGGSGIGLYGNKKKIDAMHPDDVESHIGVMSKEGEGSTFWFEVWMTRLVEKEAAEAKKTQSGAVVIPESEKARNKTLNILVVDDNQINCKVLSKQLTQIGCDAKRIQSAYSGADALKLSSKQRFDVVLMDEQMPEMDGTETAKRIRALEKVQGIPPTFVVACTASALAQTPQDRDEVCPKPCIAADLAVLVNKYFKSAQEVFLV